MRAARFLAVVTVLLLTAGVAACGGGTGSATPARQSNVAKSPSQPSAPTKTPVTVAVGANALDFAPLWVAEGEHYFDQQGLAVTLAMVAGSQATTALESGDAQFAVVSGSLVDLAHSKGVPLWAVASMMSRFTMDLVMSNRLVHRDHVNLKAAVNQRLRLLKGQRIGITTPGSATDVFIHVLMKRAGLPRKDAKLIAVGGGASLVAALKSGEIDSFALSPPVPQMAMAAHIGEIVVSGAKGEVPGLANMAYGVVVASKSWSQAHASVTSKFVAAIAKACNLIRTHEDKALAGIERHFPTVKPTILKAAVGELAPAVPQGARMTEAQWHNTTAIDAESGLLTTAASPKEGVLWTNRFLPAQ